jgi:ubiquinone biosynthesis protein
VPLRDWRQSVVRRGEDFVDEAQLAADLGELALDFSDAQLKDLKIGVLLHEYRRSCASTRSCCLPISLYCSRHSSVLRDSGASTIQSSVWSVKPFLDRAMYERYQPIEAVRRGQATLMGLVTAMPRDLARLIKDARHGRMRVDLDLKRLDSFGDRVHSAIDRATIGIMTASVVIGSSIVMTIEGGPSLFGVPLLPLCGFVGYLMAFVNSLWVIVSIWRSGRH